MPIKPVLAVASCVALTGCLFSQGPLYDTSDAVQPFPRVAAVVRMGGKTMSGYFIERKGSGYAVLRHKRFQSIRVIPAAGLSGHYILQVRQKDGKYFYEIVKIDGRILTHFGVATARLIRKYKLSGYTKAQKGTGYYTNSRYAVLRMLKKAVSDPQTTKTRYRIYDWNNSSHRSALKALVQRYQRAKEEADYKKRQEKRKKEGRSRPSGKRYWVYVGRKDAMTDRIVHQVIGRAFRHTGAKSAPVIRFLCRPRYPIVEFHWMVPLASFLENKNHVHMVAQVRFDQTPRKLLLMVPSGDRRVTYEMNDLQKAGMKLSMKIFEMFKPEIRQVNVNWTASQLIVSMKRARRMIIRSPTVHGGNVTAFFNMDGFEEAIRNFPARCR